jgi:hypothetical protein
MEIMQKELAMTSFGVVVWHEVAEEHRKSPRIVIVWVEVLTVDFLNIIKSAFIVILLIKV